MTASEAPVAATASATAAPRYDGVQALRFVAALLVVVTHSTFYAHERLDRGIAVWNEGVTGVDIFFVISGFVIVIASRKLIGRPGAAGDFAARRLIRIVPLYWIATTLNLAVLLVVPAAVLHSDLDWWNITSSYLFLPSFDMSGKLEPLLGVGWTLNFEMFFYAVFALALLVRRNVYAVVGVVMVACAVVSIWRQPDWPAIAFYLSPRVVEFLAGMLLAAWAVRRRMPAPLAAALVLVGFVVLLAGPHFLPPMPFLLRKGLPALLIVWGVVALEPVLAPRLPRGLVTLGSASYAIYLFHPMIAPVVPAVASRLGLDVAPLVVLGSVILSVVIATVLHLILERPITARLNAARRRRENTRNRTLDSPVSAGRAGEGDGSSG